MLMQRQNTEVFSALGTQLGKMNASLVTQGAMSGVSEFSGREKVTDWILEIDKCQSIHRLSDADTCQLAWAKSRGNASRQIGRKLKENPELEWAELKSGLEQEYGRIVDNQQAFVLLTNVKQGKEEAVSSFMERFLALTSRAYGEDWRTTQTELVQEQLVTLFMEGLRSQDIKLRIYRKQVKKVDEAINIAKAEELAKKRFPGDNTPRSRQEEEMEVDHHRRAGCFQCGGPHGQRNCPRNGREDKRIHAVVSQRLDKGDRNPNSGRLEGGKRRMGRRYDTASNGWNDQRGRNQDSSRIAEDDRRYRRCFFCHQPGHYRFQCKARTLN